MYSSPQQSPPPNYAYQEYRPQGYVYTTAAPGATYTFVKPETMNYTTSSARRSSQAYTYTQSPPIYFDPPAYSYATPAGYTIKTSVAQPRRTDYTSATERLRSKVKAQTRPSPSKKAPVRETFVVDEKDDVYGYSYSPKGSPPPPYHAPAYEADYWSGRYFDFEKEKERSKSQKHAEPSQPATRPRTASQSTPLPKQSSKEKTKTGVKSHRAATAADAAKAGIPAGYSYKNWDPTEEPIYLLGSVFDANSLGKWVYDWTVYYHGPATPMSDLAGDLWLLLIQLAGKIKRADACRSRIRRRSDRDLIDDFLESGDRLWDRLSKILKACEDFMWRAAKQERKSSGASVSMGAQSGGEFVESMFGRDRRLEETEKLMTSMRLWNMRFDANCEDILRHPSG